MSKIEWTQKTWNPTIGCTEVSAGCVNCYAAKMAYRLAHIPAMAEDYAGLTKKLPNGKIVWTGVVKEMPERLTEFLNIKKPTIVFLDSMSDLFHKDVSWNYIYKVFEMMMLSPQHTYQVLTKRAERLPIISDIYLHLKRNYPDAEIPFKNVWIGVSVEDQKAADERIPFLLQIPAAVRFLSCEPLLGSVDVKKYLRHIETGRYSGWVQDIHWVIAGGESGNNARPMHPDWARSLRDQCDKAGVSFFFKQWGEYADGAKGLVPVEKWMMVGNDGSIYKNDDVVPRVLNCTLMTKVGKKASGRLLDGKEYNEFPNQFLNSK